MYSAVWLQEDRCFSVCVQLSHKVDIVDLIAPTIADKNLWVRGLTLLIKKSGEADLLQQQNRYGAADVTYSGTKTCTCTKS